MKEEIRSKKYFVRGMHCASCEILIEKKLLELPGVEAVDASTGRGEVLIGYSGQAPDLGKLNEIFKKSGYFFSEREIKEAAKIDSSILGWLILAGALIFAVFKLDLFGAAASINSGTSLPMFFVFGLLAGFSSCAALVGGLILSLAKQWSEIHSAADSFGRKMTPHFLFNIGRLISYAVFGALLGLIGQKIQFSFAFSSFLVLAVSLLMLILGLQMLGVKALARFQLRAPKFIIRRAANEKNFQSRHAPFVMGVLTFFLPCGFTITAQGIALLSGSWFSGSLIMAFFALGTLGPLLAIGAFSIALTNKFQKNFLKFAGILVLAFALFNINAQFNALGWASFSDLKASEGLQAQGDNGGSQKQDEKADGLAEIVGGKQIIRMSVSGYSYSPDKFKVKAGLPVRWEITDKGFSGCTSAVISRGLFAGEISLIRGGTAVKEFIPQSPGRYKFSCWMGMVSGMIEVVK